MKYPFLYGKSPIHTVIYLFFLNWIHIKVTTQILGVGRDF